MREWMLSSTENRVSDDSDGPHVAFLIVSIFVENSTIFECLESVVDLLMHLFAESVLFALLLDPHPVLNFRGHVHPSSLCILNFGVNQLIFVDSLLVSVLGNTLDFLGGSKIYQLDRGQGALSFGNAILDQDVLWLEILVNNISLVHEIDG